MNHTPSILCSYGLNPEPLEETGDHLYFVMSGKNGQEIQQNFLHSFIHSSPPPLCPQYNHTPLPGPTCLLAGFPPPAAAMLPPCTQTCYELSRPPNPVNSQNCLVIGQKPCLSSSPSHDSATCERHGEAGTLERLMQLLWESSHAARRRAEAEMAAAIVGKVVL